VVVGQAIQQALLLASPTAQVVALILVIQPTLDEMALGKVVLAGWLVQVGLMGLTARFLLRTGLVLRLQKQLAGRSSTQQQVRSEAPTQVRVRVQVGVRRPIMPFRLKELTFHLSHTMGTFTLSVVLMLPATVKTQCMLPRLAPTVSRAYGIRPIPTHQVGYIGIKTQTLALFALILRRQPIITGFI
jgi:hypothetical protein